jgi:hypothetical protein
MVSQNDYAQSERYALGRPTLIPSRASIQNWQEVSAALSTLYQPPADQSFCSGLSDTFVSLRLKPQAFSCCVQVNAFSAASVFHTWLNTFTSRHVMNDNQNPQCLFVLTYARKE